MSITTINNSNDDDDVNKYYYKMKPDIDLHFFISYSSCGDALIYELKNTNTKKEETIMNFTYSVIVSICWWFISIQLDCMYYLMLLF